jgi:DNA-binding transcriptional LysR family regulator
LSDLRQVVIDVQSAAGVLMSPEIDVFPSVATFYLPPKLWAWQSSGWKVTLHVRSTSDEILQMLQLGQVDAAIMETPASVSGFWCRELLVEPFVAVVPPDHPLSGKESVDVANLADYPLNLYPPTCDV